MSGYTCEVPIPPMFQRLVGKPQYLTYVSNVQLTEAGCLEVPASMRYICIREEDPLVDFRVVSRLLGEQPQSLFGITDLDRLSPYTTTLDHLDALVVIMDGFPVQMHGAATGTTRGRLVELHGEIEQDGQFPMISHHLNPQVSEWELRDRREQEEEREAGVEELGAAVEFDAGEELPLFLPTPSFMASAEEEQGTGRAFL